MVSTIIFRGIGIVGLLIIIRSIFIKNEARRDWMGIGGGICLFVYSVYLRDAIFTLLEFVFIISSLVAIRRIQKAEHTLPIAVSNDEIVDLLTQDQKNS